MRALATVLLLAPTTALAGTVRVGPGQAYTDLGAAVSAAAAGDTVLVDPGTYPAATTIPVGKALTVKANGTGVVVTATSIDVDLPGLAGQVRITSPLDPWRVRPLSPGAMGWYAWVPAMECYHQVVSFGHALDAAVGPRRSEPRGEPPGSGRGCRRGRLRCRPGSRADGHARRRQGMRRGC